MNSIQEKNQQNNSTEEVQPKQNYIISLRKAAAERRKEILAHWQENGAYAVPMRIWAEKFGVSVGTIQNDCKFILNSFPMDSINDVASKILMGFKSAISRMERAAIEDPKNYKKNLAVIASYEKFTKFLEDWGFKERIAERLQVSTFNIDYTKPLTKEQEDDILDLLKK